MLTSSSEPVSQGTHPATVSALNLTLMQYICTSLVMARHMQALGTDPQMKHLPVLPSGWGVRQASTPVCRSTVGAATGVCSWKA